MTEALRSWIVGIAGAAMITAVAMTVTPEGRVKKIVSLVCGLMTVIALVRPIVGFDYRSFSEYLAQHKSEAEAFSSDIDSANENLTRRIIEERCQAYILDKGKSLGITDLEASVQLSWSVDGHWYPCGASLRTNAGEDKRQELGRDIEAELGIPSEGLNWSMYDE
jgi:stage III sporulation protein AF